MHTQITVYCPRCKGYKKNGSDDNQKQRYACEDCTRRRFIGDHHITYKGRNLCKTIRRHYRVGGNPFLILNRFLINQIKSII